MLFVRNSDVFGGGVIGEGCGVLSCGGGLIVSGDGGGDVVGGGIVVGDGVVQ